MHDDVLSRVQNDWINDSCALRNNLYLRRIIFTITPAVNSLFLHVSPRCDIMESNSFEKLRYETSVVFVHIQLVPSFRQKTPYHIRSLFSAG